MSKIISKIVASIARFIGYYDDILYRVVIENGNRSLVPATNNFKPIFLVVSRKHFTESVEKFPVDDRGELKKLLNLKKSPGIVYLFRKTFQGQSLVNRWQIDSLDVSAQFVIPESYLLGKSLTNNKIVEMSQNGGDTCFIGKLNDCTYSGAKSPLLNSAQRFAESIGIAADNVQVIDSNGKVGNLLNGIKKVSLKELVVFKSARTTSQNSINLPAILGVSVAFISLYLAVTSLYLVIKVQTLDSKDAEMKAKVGVAIDLQERLSQEIKSIKMLELSVNERPQNSAVWPVLASIFDEVKLSNISLKDNTLKIRGQAENASAFLEELVKNPNVISAKFDSPTRRASGKERFNISITLNPEWTIEKPLEQDNG